MGDGEYSDVSLAAAEVISDARSKKYEPPVDPNKGKHPRESAVGIAYLFSQDQFLLETYRNPCKFWCTIRSMYSMYNHSFIISSHSKVVHFKPHAHRG